jgi:hypothetical protein
MGRNPGVVIDATPGQADLLLRMGKVEAVEVAKHGDNLTGSGSGNAHRGTNHDRRGTQAMRHPNR